MDLIRNIQRMVLATLLYTFVIISHAQTEQEAPLPEEQTESATAMQSIGGAFWEAWNRVFEVISESEIVTTPDPFESLNRRVFAFNDTADRYVLKPVAEGYQWITPDPVEKGVSNVFGNIFEVTTIANDLLQFKFTQAASDTARFVVNSTVGIAGIFDVATSIGLEKHNEDFGQTLGYWGIGDGPYVVVPLLGSYTFRSGIGTITQTYTTDLLPKIDHVPTRNSTIGGRFIDTRANLLVADDLITGDRYTFVRDAYLQRREFLVNDGVVEDSFGDEDFEDDWDDEDWD